MLFVSESVMIWIVSGMAGLIFPDSKSLNILIDFKGAMGQPGTYRGAPYVDIKNSSAHVIEYIL